MNKEDQILSATIRDKIKRAENRGIPVWTGFLSPAEVSLAESVCIAEKAKFLLEGGYEDAERRICVALSIDDSYAPDFEPSDALCVLGFELPKGSPELSHRDYLGAMLGLGVERSVIGDIIVRKDGADAVILREMDEFFINNITTVGRASVSCSIKELSELKSAAVRTEEYRDTVSSLRLDSVASSAFRMARGKAQEFIKQGLVSVNGRQSLKPDAELKEGDRISMRGKGKAVLSEVGGRSKKDRIVITITRFI